MATQLRFPVVGDLARSVRFRWFDQPGVDEDRSSVLARVGPEIEAIAGLPAGDERSARLDALAGIPERIVSFLGRRFEDGLPETEPMLAVLIKRHYHEHAISEVGETQIHGRPFATADYTLDGRYSHLVSTIANHDELTPDSEFTADLTAQVESREEGVEGVVDLYLHWPEAPASDDEASAQLAATLAALPVTTPCAASPSGCPAMPARWATSPSAPPGWRLTEDLLVRNVHPMVGRRLASGGCATDLTRPRGRPMSCCSRARPGNAADQRLFALAQVRQFSVARDEAGNVVALPHPRARHRELSEGSVAPGLRRSAAPDWT